MKKLNYFLLLLLLIGAQNRARAEVACEGAMAGEANPQLSAKYQLPEVSTDDVRFFADQKAKLVQYAEESGSLEKGMQKLLSEKEFSATEIQERIASYQSGKKGSFERVLGFRTLDETRHFLVGSSIHKVSPDSAVGKYLAITGAKSEVVRIPLVQGEAELGPPKLLVAISAQTWPEFQKILKMDDFMTVMGHANVLHRGKFYGCGGGKAGDCAVFNSLNTPLPFLLFNTTEGARLNRYLTQVENTFGWTNPTKQPWLLGDYCAKGGYNCCTHWIGNIPIGDQLVSEYKFPLYNRPAKEAVSKELKAYQAGTEAERQIWKVPGHEQLASAIGLEESNLNGEFASPGWVIQSLLGAASTERVPVVFVMTADVKAELPKVQQFNFERPW